MGRKTKASAGRAEPPVVRCGAPAAEERLRATLRGRREALDRNAAKIGEWLLAVRALYGQIREWCAPLVREGLLYLHERRVRVTGDDTPPYDAPALLIQEASGWWTVEATPVARFTIGAAGRVDLVHAHHKHMLLRGGSGSEATWEIEHDRVPYRQPPVPLTAEALLGLLYEIAQDTV